MHVLHLTLAGVFDRYPDLQFVLGHWGESIPFLDRLDEALPQRLTKLDRTFREYFRDNVFITPSGMFSQAQLRYCVDTVGVDRIIHAVDFPMIGNEGAVPFLADSDRSVKTRTRSPTATPTSCSGSTESSDWSRVAVGAAVQRRPGGPCAR